MGETAAVLSFFCIMAGLIVLGIRWRLRRRSSSLGRMGAWETKRNTLAALGDCLLYFFSNQPYRVLEVNTRARNDVLEDELKRFEREFVYPLGEESEFRIIHGKGGRDYFGFYTTLGRPVVLVARNTEGRGVVKTDEEGTEHEYFCRENEVAAIGCGVLREMALPGGGRASVWYICDVKVGVKYRGEHIPLSMLCKGLWRVIQCSSGYFVSMDPANGQAPYAARLWSKRTVFGRSSETLTLNIYSLSAEACRSSRQQVEEVCGGPILFKSMEGKKDFEIFSKGGAEARDWKLLHIQHGLHGDREVSSCVYGQPRDGYDHLIASFSGSSLDGRLRAIEGISMFGTATLVHYNLDPGMFCDTIMTNEI